MGVPLWWSLKGRSFERIIGPISLYRMPACLWGWGWGWVGSDCWDFGKGVGSCFSDLQTVVSVANWDQLRLLQDPVFITLVVLPEKINRPDPVVFLSSR